MNNEPISSAFSQPGVTPLVTVAMPVYNAGKYLRLAVLSIIQQTFSNWELLIIDDGSTDNALQGLADINDARIRIFRDGSNRGLAARLNEVVDMAQGRYLARMDADDVSYPERFARQIAALQNDPKLDLVATRAIMINEEDQATGLFPAAISHEEVCARPWLGFYFPHPTWMGRIEWFRAHPYAVPAPYCCEDQELLLRSYRESRFATLNEILFAYRLRSEVNWQKLARTRRTVFIAQVRHFAGLRRWIFVMMALTAFVAKTIRDFSKRMGPGTVKPGCDISSNVTMLEWYRVLAMLQRD